MINNRQVKIKEFKYLMISTIIVMLFTIIAPILIINSKIVVIDSEETKVNEDVVDIVDEQNKNIVINGESNVSVYITETGTIEEVPLEEYICGVVSNEMPANFEKEALKAQAVAARTYLASKKQNKCPLAEGADICDSVHCQVYTSKEKRLEKWDASYAESYWNKIQEAVNETKGKVLSYNNELVLYPQFFSTSSGETENSEDAYLGEIPYLRSVSSTGEESAPKYTSDKEISLSDFIYLLNSNYSNLNIDVNNIKDKFSIKSRSEAGGVISIQIGNETIKGTDFRRIMSLNSTNFTYEFFDNSIIFHCKGYGHGVGMSQWGANAMAKNGSSYDEILNHYYTGIEIKDLEFTQ